MNEIFLSALERASRCSTVFAKFLTPADTNCTEQQPRGLFIPQDCEKLFLQNVYTRDELNDFEATIVWNDGATTENVFRHHSDTENAGYWLEGFDAEFEPLSPGHCGDLFLLCKDFNGNHYAYTLSNDEDIQTLLGTFLQSPTELNCLIQKRNRVCNPELEEPFEQYVTLFRGDFPQPNLLALYAREADRAAHGDTAAEHPDETLVRWVDTARQFFQYIEDEYYGYINLVPANDLHEFIETSLTITYRRKLHLAKTLEKHLAGIFEACGVSFDANPDAAANKKSGFVLPSEEAVQAATQSVAPKTVLDVSPTCKTQWRSALTATEAETRYLFTLQPCVPADQLSEMNEAGVTLVVPQDYLPLYEELGASNVLSLSSFIARMLAEQGGSAA